MALVLTNTKSRHNIIVLSTLFIFCFLLYPSVNAETYNPKSNYKAKLNRPPLSLESLPIVEYAAHNRGNIQLVIANNGTFGTEGNTVIDPFTGIAIQSCVYPKNSDIVFLWVGGLWIGAIVGRDTLVSSATDDYYETKEFWPDIKPKGDIIKTSIDPDDLNYSTDAYSEEDILCVYYDTITNPSLVEMDSRDQRPHQPLNIKVTQRSMAWSYSYADDFILFDYSIKNIGFEDLEKVYFGIYVDADVWHTTRKNPEGWSDDIVGFYRETKPEGDCGFIDTVNIAFTADNDGDPIGNSWDYRSTLGVVGTRVVRTPSDSLKYSYNWWIINSEVSRDFGPRQQHTADDPFRNFGGRLGTPLGDLNRYYIMSHEEFDYDLMYAAVDHSEQGWLSPPRLATEYAEGFDTRYLLSFGPFNINPGQELPITFCWVGGEDLHTGPKDYENYFDPYNPNEFYNHLNFDNLAKNSLWASWVFDNPGIDTDNDGYRGKFRVCDDDTIYYEGDGVPDFRGASPPPAPKFWVEPSVGELYIRFNGFRTETTKDAFANILDFEGYRVYLSRDDRAFSYALVTSFDIEDFNKYIIDIDADTTFYFSDKGDTIGFNVSTSSDIKLKDPPFEISDLRCLYAPDGCDDQIFDPYNHPRNNPLQVGDSLFYFEPQDFNASLPGINTRIYKIYPDQPYPSTLVKSEVDPSELTDDGYFKYFEYETLIENLLPTVPYYVNVVAFDFGSPKAGLASLESSVTIGSVVAYPLSSAGEVSDRNLKAYVYPNPYIIEDEYAIAGFENRKGNLATERARRLNFANLPAKCIIQIFSLDGDLIREIDHDKDPLDPTASHDEWDMITRNTQSIVSGLYYFVIDSGEKSQVGKFVIIK